MMKNENVIKYIEEIVEYCRDYASFYKKEGIISSDIEQVIEAKLDAMCPLVEDLEECYIYDYKRFREIVENLIGFGSMQKCLDMIERVSRYFIQHLTKDQFSLSSEKDVEYKFTAWLESLNHCYELCKCIGELDYEHQLELNEQLDYVIEQMQKYNSPNNLFFTLLTIKYDTMTYLNDYRDSQFMVDYITTTVAHAIKKVKDWYEAQLATFKGASTTTSSDEITIINKSCIAEEMLTQEQIEDLNYDYTTVDVLKNYVTDLKSVEDDSTRDVVEDIRCFIENIADQYESSALDILEKIYDKLSHNCEIDDIEKLINQFKSEIEKPYTTSQLTMCKIRNAKSVDEVKLIINQFDNSSNMDYQIDLDKFFKDYELVYDLINKSTSKSKSSVYSICDDVNHKNYTICLTPECIAQRAMIGISGSNKRFLDIIDQLNKKSYESEHISNFVADLHKKYSSYEATSRDSLIATIETTKFQIDLLYSCIDKIIYKEDCNALKQALESLKDLKHSI